MHVLVDLRSSSTWINGVYCDLTGDICNIRDQWITLCFIQFWLFMLYKLVFKTPYVLNFQISNIGLFLNNSYLLYFIIISNQWIFKILKSTSNKVKGGKLLLYNKIVKTIKKRIHKLLWHYKCYLVF